MSQDHIFSDSSSPDWLRDASRVDESFFPESAQYQSIVSHQVFGVSSTARRNTFIVTRGILIPNSFCTLDSATFIVGRWEGVFGRDYFGFPLLRQWDRVRIGFVLAPDYLLPPIILKSLRNSIRVSARRLLGFIPLFRLPRLQSFDLHLDSFADSPDSSSIENLPRHSGLRLYLVRRLLEARPASPIFADPDAVGEELRGLEVWVRSEIRTSQESRNPGEWVESVVVVGNETLYGFEWQSG